MQNLLQYSIVLFACLIGLESNLDKCGGVWKCTAGMAIGGICQRNAQSSEKPAPTKGYSPAATSVHQVS